MAYDALEMRCPRLGGPVTFLYCRDHAGPAGPCPGILDCWWQRFDVAEHLRRQLAPASWDAICRPRHATKIATLVELIAAAQKNAGRE